MNGPRRIVRTVDREYELLPWHEVSMSGQRLPFVSELAARAFLGEISADTMTFGVLRRWLDESPLLPDDLADAELLEILARQLVAGTLVVVERARRDGAALHRDAVVEADDSGLDAGGSPVNESETQPTVYGLAWSKSEVEVCAEVYAELNTENCNGGERVTLIFYECDEDGGRREVDRKTEILSAGSSRVSLPWSRSEEQAEADLLADEESGDGLFEYRFATELDGKNVGESPPLRLLTTVEWSPTDIDGVAVPDGTCVVCTRADGEEMTAVIAGGKARFEGIPVGTTRFAIKPREITDLCWSERRVPAGQPVNVCFKADGFVGGEMITIRVFECDSNGRREEIDSVETELPAGSGGFSAAWSRGEQGVLEDLLRDCEQSDALIEYRFEVEIDGTRASESPALYLTFGVTLSPQGSDGAPLPDGAVVVCVEADGHMSAAVVHDGHANFADLLLGSTAFFIDTPEGE